MKKRKKAKPLTDGAKNALKKEPRVMGVDIKGAKPHPRITRMAF